MIPFNRPAVTGNELPYIQDALSRAVFSGNNHYNKLCCRWFKDRFGVPLAQVVPSGTHALELAALLLDLHQGDEVIMASFGFSSTANAFALRGARVVFVDIRPDTMNLDETLLEAAITPRTRAIVPMHYAGVPCAMDRIEAIAARHHLAVVEDSAQALLSSHQGRPCGTMGTFGCFSFHETKNIHCGEGGALLVNDPELVGRAEILQEKGTNRLKFFRGEIDKYTWVDLGSSWVVNEMTTAFLYAQLEEAEDLTVRRLSRWQSYQQALQPLVDRGYAELPQVPADCIHNGHIFYLKVADEPERTRLIDHLKRNGVHAVFHYVPLHSAPAGLAYGRFTGEDRWTTRESERLVRLPLFSDLEENTLQVVAEQTRRFYGA